jgi:hypothetical protein
MADAMIGQAVKFWDWNDAGEEVQITGIVETEFTDPEDTRPSFGVRVGVKYYTPYVDECSSA